MRNALLMSAALLGLTAGAALAQQPNSTQNSDPTLPGTVAPVPGRTDAAPPAAGMPGDGMTGMRPMRGQQRQSAQGMHHGSPAAMHGSRATRSARAPMNEDRDAPSMGEYRGGVGSPTSRSASNINASDTRSEIAPRLPDPNAASSTAEGYIAAARRALAGGRTGAAQEALERAETRLLTRSTDPSMANTPDNGPMVQRVSEARRALASRDTASARAALDMLSDGGQGQGSGMNRMDNSGMNRMDNMDRSSAPMMR